MGSPPPFCVFFCVFFCFVLFFLQTQALEMKERRMGGRGYTSMRARACHRSSRLAAQLKSPPPSGRNQNSSVRSERHKAGERRGCDTLPETSRRLTWDPQGQTELVTNIPTVNGPKSCTSASPRQACCGSPLPTTGAYIEVRSRSVSFPLD